MRYTDPSHGAISWRMTGAILLGFSTGLAAAWMWTFIEIYQMFF